MCCLLLWWPYSKRRRQIIILLEPSDLHFPQSNAQCPWKGSRVGRSRGLSQKPRELPPNQDTPSQQHFYLPSQLGWQMLWTKIPKYQPGREHWSQLKNIALLILISCLQCMLHEIFQVLRKQPTAVFLPGEFHGHFCPGRLQSMGSQRVRHDWVTNPFTFL